MTLSRKKRAAKEQARMERRTAHLAPEYQNRRFPDGTLMDPQEAMIEFVPFITAPQLFTAAIPGGCDVLVEYVSDRCPAFQLWLCDVTPSVVADEYQGTISDDVPRNEHCLGPDASIMFERRHVIRVRPA